MKKLSFKAFGLAGLTACFFAMASSANAAGIVYNLDSTDVGAYGTGPYGTVTLTETGTAVDFNITLRSDLNFVNTGNHSVFSFNALDVATTDISGIEFNGVANTNYTVVAPGTNPPFGNNSFTLMIDCTVAANCQNGSGGQQVDPLTFSVANAVLTDFGFITATTTAFFAADVICTAVLTDGCTTVGSTGAVGGTTPGTPTDPDEPPPGVPVPGTLLLLGLGLLGLRVSRRKVV